MDGHRIHHFVRSLQLVVFHVHIEIEKEIVIDRKKREKEIEIDRKKRERER